jgi:poly-gamma-glutamate capsule biosynthesis protein CapA/YwtB (metallophosphatase superfamily)
MAPAIIQAGGMKVSVISLTDNTPGWSAGAEKPGVFHIPLWSPHLLDKFANSVMLWPKTSAQISSAISKARSKSDLVIFSAHTGPNNVERPSAILRQLANMAIKGADVFHGHSAHAFQGISMSRAKPILFDCGDFIDVYPHNPIYHNEWGFIYLLDFRETELQGMRLVPVEISNCQVNLAKGEAAKNIIARMERLSKEMGTKMEVRGQRLIFQQQ